MRQTIHRVGTILWQQNDGYEWLQTACFHSIKSLQVLSQAVKSIPTKSPDQWNLKRQCHQANRQRVV